MKKTKILTVFFMLAVICGVHTSTFAASEAKKEAVKKPVITLTAAEKSNAPVELPSINEIHRNAKGAGITANWGKLIKLSTPEYSKLNPANKAFTAGKALSDVAFLTLTAKKDTPPSKEAIDAAYNALSSLKLPTEIEKEVNLLKEQAGHLTPKELRKKMDVLLSEAVSQLDQDANPAIRDSGSLVLAAGYFKAFYLGAATVSGYDKPTPAQLQMFKWDGLVTYFINYFTTQASPEYKNDPVVKSFVAALENISPIVNKKREEINKDDVKNIEKSLMQLFG